jgi:hypothetical protein
LDGQQQLLQSAVLQRLVFADHSVAMTAVLCLSALCVLR